MNLQEIINSLEILSQEEQSILFEILRDRQKQKNQDFLVRSLRGKYAHLATSSYDFALRKQKEIDIVLDACAVIAFFGDEEGEKK